MCLPSVSGSYTKARRLCFVFHEAQTTVRSPTRAIRLCRDFRYLCVVPPSSLLGWCVCYLPLSQPERTSSRASWYNSTINIYYYSVHDRSPHLCYNLRIQYTLSTPSDLRFCFEVKIYTEHPTPHRPGRRGISCLPPLFLKLFSTPRKTGTQTEQQKQHIRGQNQRSPEKGQQTRYY